MTTTDPPEEFGLVMPFVVCKSNGGALDDHAFVVGMQLGEIDAQLQICRAMNVGAVPNGRYLDSDGIAQLDLIAMRHGFSLTREVLDENPAWTWVEFANAGGGGSA